MPVRLTKAVARPADQMTLREAKENLHIPTLLEVIENNRTDCKNPRPAVGSTLYFVNDETADVLYINFSAKTEKGCVRSISTLGDDDDKVVVRVLKATENITLANEDQG